MSGWRASMGSGWVLGGAASLLLLAGTVAVPRSLAVISSHDEEMLDDLRQTLRRQDPDALFDASMPLALLGQKAVSPLLEALQDEDPIVRANAAVALGWVPGNGEWPRKEMVRALLGALSDEDRRVRFNASVTLAGVDLPEAQEAVERYRKEEALRKW